MHSIEARRAMRVSTHDRRRGLSAAGLLSILLTLGLTACEDFLSTEPKGDLTSGNFFETPEHAIQATNATYSILRQWETHVFMWIGMTDIASDDATKGSIPGDAGFLGDLDDLVFDPVNAAIGTSWDGYYQGVYRANVALEGIPGIDMDAQLKARLIGENKFLRAYFYFFLVRAYGGVPLVTRPLVPGEFNQPRATAQAVYDQIEQDLLDAIDVLPETYGDADVGRATSGAARAMLAQVYLYQGEYASALQYAEEVINSPTTPYSLLPDYATIFTFAGENSSESVFEIQVAVGPGGFCQPWQGCAATQYAEVQGVRGTPNIGWGFNTVSPALEADYEPGDPRLQATALYEWETLPDGTGRVVYLVSVPNNRYNQKAFKSVGGPNDGTNIRRIRYADVLLTAAEAAYQTAGEGPARAYLNQVRQRARGARTITLGLTPEELNPSIGQGVLGLAPTESQVFVRYVNPASDGHAAGLRSADSRVDNSVDPPAQFDTLDIIRAVDAVAVTTLAEYYAELETKTPTVGVTLDIFQITQDPTTGVITTQTFQAVIPAQELLPDVDAAVTGQNLLEAIWHERRVELAMEQHRMFDLRRQEAVSPGRAATLMAAHGKAWQSCHMLYPVPETEVQIGGLTQNPPCN